MNPLQSIGKKNFFESRRCSWASPIREYQIRPYIVEGCRTNRANWRLILYSQQRKSPAPPPPPGVRNGIRGLRTHCFRQRADGRPPGGRPCWTIATMGFRPMKRRLLSYADVRIRHEESDLARKESLVDNLPDACHRTIRKLAVERKSQISRISSGPLASQLSLLALSIADTRTRRRAASQFASPVRPSRKTPCRP